MAWNAPATATVGQLVTASFWNAQIRDNFLALNVAPAQSATVAAAQTTTSTSYTDLTTAGPSVTLETGATVWVALAAEINHNNVRHYMSVAVSGATTTAASDNHCLLVVNADTFADNKHAVSFPLTVTPGSNTFTTKYKSGTGTVTFGYRSLTVGRATAVS